MFKRYKSLLGLGNIPGKTKESGEVWLNGKMFLALLIEKYHGAVNVKAQNNSFLLSVLLIIPPYSESISQQMG